MVSEPYVGYWSSTPGITNKLFNFQGPIVGSQKCNILQVSNGDPMLLVFCALRQWWDVRILMPCSKTENKYWESQKINKFMQRHGEWIASKVSHAMVHNNEHVLF